MQMEQRLSLLGCSKMNIIKEVDELMNIDLNGK